MPEDGSIAVLPFADMSEAGDQEYFSDGLTEELLNALAQVPGMRVAARTSSFAFKGRNVPVDSIGRALRVRHLLEGSVRKAGGRGSAEAAAHRRRGSCRQGGHAQHHGARALFAARHFWNRRTRDDLLKALELYREATAVDPGYARAHAGFAETYAVIPN